MSENVLSEHRGPFRTKACPIRNPSNFNKMMAKINDIYFKKMPKRLKNMPDLFILDNECNP